MRLERDRLTSAILSQESQEKDGMGDKLVEEILLQIDAANGFNSLSRLVMLWIVRPRCLKLSWFAFNCYRHQAQLVCRRPCKEALIIADAINRNQVKSVLAGTLSPAPILPLLRRNSIYYVPPTILITLPPWDPLPHYPMT